MSDSQPPVPQPQPPAQVYVQQVVVARNGFATAALVLGIVGFVLTFVPLFIGYFLGGLPDLLAVIFGIIGIVKGGPAGVGRGAAITGLVLGGVAIILMFFGAGLIF
jgi:hypothetical protein